MAATGEGGSWRGGEGKGGRGDERVEGGERKVYRKNQQKIN